MTTLVSEPFGKPTLLLEFSLPSDKNHTTTFISSGLLDPGVSNGSGDGGEGEESFCAQSPPCAARSDVAGFADDNEPSEFMPNGLLDGPTRMKSTANLF